MRLIKAMKMRAYHFLLGLVLLVSAVSRADISAQTNASLPYVHLENSLQGSFGEAVIDAAQLGLALSSLITGDSMLISGALDALNGGIYAAPVNRIYGAWNAIQETQQLLNSASDKALHSEALVRVSKDSRYPTFNINFLAHSDDDPFGNLKVDVTADPNIRVSVRGQGTKEGAIAVDMNVRQLPPGLYPLVFFAKETDCSICLSIAHTVFVDVYDPCPNLNPICANDVNNYYKAWDNYRNRRAALTGITSRGGQALGRIKVRENACYRAHGAVATGGGSSEAARHQADLDFYACLERVEQYEALLRGACPELAYAATPQQCQALRNRTQFLAPYLAAVDRAIAGVNNHNCCQEQINPRGGSGPIIFRPPVIVKPPPSIN